MSVDSWRAEYHLTEYGWLSGATSFYGKYTGEDGKYIDKKPPDPPGVLETWLRHEKQTSAFSTPCITWTLVRRVEDVDIEHIRELRDRYTRYRRSLIDGGPFDEDTLSSFSGPVKMVWSTQEDPDA